MKNITLSELIASRPRAYGWLKFQRVLLWLFVVMGSLALVATLFVFSFELIKFFLIYEACKVIAHRFQLNEKEVEQVLNTAFDSIEIAATVFCFSLAICFFIIARYCQKTINRNTYILRLENEFKKLNTTLPFPEKD